MESLAGGRAQGNRVTREYKRTTKWVIKSWYSEENNSLLQFTMDTKFAYAMESL